jgi:hypothetical protein
MAIGKAVDASTRGAPTRDHAGGPVAHVVGRAVGGVHMAQQRRRRAEEVAPRTRQRDLAGRAVEEAEAEDQLEFGDQLAHRLRREPQA